ncbi:hypothetical protein [Streptomyces erythrochromogenes]|uniref:hypothetical protein n=1 Tax=Streptomyces erythrochromogenes TaxID=285574 RepID=UPI003804E13A
MIDNRLHLPRTLLSSAACLALAAAALLPTGAHAAPTAPGTNGRDPPWSSTAPRSR